MLVGRVDGSVLLPSAIHSSFWGFSLDLRTRGLGRERGREMGREGKTYELAWLYTAWCCA
jgi:hypothetical protein